ncbi:hypothetical protein [Staphylococcus capitis]|uniref:hypothetical protein n=1 Tax=Staphylococcus capitis TaxID=29388 RepID=UPI00145AB415|nr:hypothetical protein [Staphylococcus capitis]MEB5628427.1 hypothetical protein [Staphylococcus capitis]NMK90620.1 hypothetical protein [Staphylococcus capitis]NMK92040.1 hypothetical protein [Staphylococcus capitis]
MKIKDVLKALELSYMQVKGTENDENKYIFIEVGWAIRRLLDDVEISYFDDFNDSDIQNIIYNEVDWKRANPFTR